MLTGLTSQVSEAATAIFRTDFESESTLRVNRPLANSRLNEPRDSKRSKTQSAYRPPRPRCNRLGKRSRRDALFPLVRIDERFTKSDRCRSVAVGRDQSGRHRISACACRVGGRDGGNCPVPLGGDPRLSGSSLAIARLAPADVADSERDPGDTPIGNERGGGASPCPITQRI